MFLTKPWYKQWAHPACPFHRVQLGKLRQDGHSPVSTMFPQLLPEPNTLCSQGSTSQTSEEILMWARVLILKESQDRAKQKASHQLQPAVGCRPGSGHKLNQMWRAHSSVRVTQNLYSKTYIRIVYPCFMIDTILGISIYT